jgi:peptide-methionine (S)-S-oxide reductase
VEEYFSRIPGVLETMVGYANGHLDNPSYEQVCAGNTGHAEACLIKYDQTLLSLEELLKRYWLIVDPTVKDRQGPDVGNQYRTGIYYLNDSDLPVIQGSLDEEQKKYKQPIVTEVSPLDCFYPAEDYHQKYLKKNPGGYCHIDFSKLTLPGD